MNARLERKLRLLAWVVAAGVIAGMAFNFAQGRTTPSSMVVGIAYGLLMSIVLGVSSCSSWKARCGCGSAAFRSRPI